MKKKEDPLFFCDNCGTEVDFNVRSCPNCGRIFTTVRCPACGYSGEEKQFTAGCPKCGYSAPPGASRDRSSKARRNRTKAAPAAPEPLPWWVYVFSALAALVALVSLLALILR